MSLTKKEENFVKTMGKSIGMAIETYALKDLRRKTYEWIDSVESSRTKLSFLIANAPKHMNHPT